MKNRIVTMYPYSPTFTNEYRITPLIYYLSRMFNTDPKFLIRERFMPSKVYQYFEINKSFMYLKQTRSQYKNIFWLTCHPPLKPIGKISKRVKDENLGMTIFDFYDDDFLDSLRYGEGYCKEDKISYFNGLQDIFSNSLTISTHQEHLDYYLNEGLKIKDHIIIPNASDPSLFKNTPLPDERVVGHIGGFGSMQGAKTRGLFLLMDAFELVQQKQKKAKLLLCGTFHPDVKKAVQKRTEGWNTEIYWERVAHYWVPQVYQKCYVFVRPLLIVRNYINRKSKIITSASGLDAAAAARPVVSTTQNAIINENGLLCRVEPEDMARKIIKLLDDRKLATELGQRGRKAIETEHNWENRARTIYEHLINNYRLERTERF